MFRLQFEVDSVLTQNSALFLNSPMDYNAVELLFEIRIGSGGVATFTISKYMLCALQLIYRPSIEAGTRYLCGSLSFLSLRAVSHCFISAPQTRIIRRFKYGARAMRDAFDGRFGRRHCRARATCVAPLTAATRTDKVFMGLV
jgi:hypothetical protein